jgi:IS4 transposase
MILPAIFDPFAKGAAATVMTRMALEWLVDDADLDQLFEDRAQSQYTRELTLSHMVHLMLDVASGVRPSPRAAFEARWEQLRVSAVAFYGKLKRMEPEVTAAVVRHLAGRARQVIEHAGGLLDEPVPGYAARILDGNVLAGTEHRVAPLRGTRAAALPGKLLAVYEPASELILEVVLSEDAYTQERALLDQIPIEAGQLWIADRNFCVRTFLFRIARRDAFFLVRRHRSTLPYEPAGDRRRVGRVETGEVFEQEILVTDPDSGDEHRLRRVILKLDEPTRDGETEIELVTNLPATVSALTCCEAYRGRWQIEGHFQKLTDLLHCEVPSLSYPRAALFAFGMSTVAGQALAMLKGNLRAVHGEEPVRELSHYALVDEVSHVYRGMMVALAAPQWTFLRDYTAAELAAAMTEVAAHVPVDRMRRSRRGPKKPRTTPKTSGKKNHHVSTRRLLDSSDPNRPP